MVFGHGEVGSRTVKNKWLAGLIPTMENMVEFWLRTLNLARHFPAFVDNGYDDLETCKKIRGADLRAVGVVEPEERARLVTAVKELREGGATQVYIMAAGASPEPFSPRRVPRSLLIKMVRLRLRNEGIHLTDITPARDNYLPLALVHLAYRYSCLLKVPQADMEVVLLEEWRAAWQDVQIACESSYSSPMLEDCSPYSISTITYSQLPSSTSVPHSLMLPPHAKHSFSRSKSSDCSLSSSSSSDSRSPSMERSKENLLDVSGLFSNLRLKARLGQRVAPSLLLTGQPRMLRQEKVYRRGLDSPF